jgi:hypothetical protein
MTVLEFNQLYGEQQPDPVIEELDLESFLEYQEDLHVHGVHPVDTRPNLWA